MIAFFDTLKQGKTFSLAYPPEGWWIQNGVAGEFIGTTTTNGYTTRFNGKGEAFAIPSPELSELAHIPVSPIQVKMEISS